MKAKHLIILVFLMLLYQYNVLFWFLFTHSRKYFFVWGLYLFIVHRKKIGFKFPNLFFLKYIFCFFVILLMTLFAAVRGGVIELMAIKIPISFVINIFAAFPIVYYLYTWSKDKDTKTIVNNAVTILICAIVANNMIAISKLIVPSIYEFLMSLQVQPERTFESISRIDAYRLGGWGENLVFSGGTSSALGIILAAYKYCNTESNNKLYFLLAILFILFSGVLIARTTIIGIPLACIILLCNIKNFRAFLKYLFVGIMLCAIIVGLFFYIVPLLDNQMASWAFELVFNFMEGGEISGESTNDLKDMWEILPTSFVTWLLGDGFFETPYGYYKGTDVGVMRIIFFIGLIGLLGIIMLFRLFLCGYHSDRELRILENALFVWFLVMNLKGIFMPVHVACLFFLINNINKRNYVQA